MYNFVVGKFNDLKMGFLLEDRNLIEAVNLSGNSLIGNIYTARVEKIVNNIEAAFLDAGLGDTLYYSIKDNADRNIYIRHTAKADKLCEGDIILVQICRDAVKNKKAEATADITFNGEYVVLNRRSVVGVSKKIDDNDRKEELREIVEKCIDSGSSDNMDNKIGAIVRTRAKDIDNEIIKEETIKLLCELNGVITRCRFETSGKLLYSDNNSADYKIREICNRFPENDFRLIEDDDAILTFDIDTKLSKLMQRIVYLKSGGCIYIDSTEAMTVIDVNSGKAIKGKDKEKSSLKLNMEAVDMICRILRVRNLSGIIIIDFINMVSPDSYRELIAYIKDVISRDPVKTTYVDTTGLGLVELTRQKEEKPLSEILQRC